MSKIKHEDVWVNYPIVGREYQHYKGGKYEVITIAKHSETDETMVVYQSLIFGSVHVRPLSMWFDDIEMVKGGVNITVRRFSAI